MRPALRIITLPLFLAIGLVCLVLSIPMMFIGLFAMLALGEDGMDFFIDYTPIMLWLDFLEELK